MTIPIHRRAQVVRLPSHAAECMCVLIAVYPWYLLYRFAVCCTAEPAATANPVEEPSVDHHAVVAAVKEASGKLFDAEATTQRLEQVPFYNK